jgi:hypothetical protein
MWSITKPPQSASRLAKSRFKSIVAAIAQDYAPTWRPTMLARPQGMHPGSTLRQQFREGVVEMYLLY